MTYITDIDKAVQCALQSLRLRRYDLVEEIITLTSQVCNRDQVRYGLVLHAVKWRDIAAIEALTKNDSALRLQYIPLAAAYGLDMSESTSQ